jgi:hypothetical protein
MDQQSNERNIEELEGKVHNTEIYVKSLENIIQIRDGYIEELEKQLKHHEISELCRDAYNLLQKIIERLPGDGFDQIQKQFSSNDIKHTDSRSTMGHATGRMLDYLFFLIKYYEEKEN